MARPNRPLENPVPVRAFGVVQALLFVLIMVTLFLFRRRQSLDAGERPENTDVRSSIARAKLQEGDARRAAGAAMAERLKAAGREAASESRAATPAAELESTFPEWTAETPAHVILGVSPGADKKTVEAAFKKLLKKYHPDRYASWGRGYQTRAHHVVLLVQQARDRMISS